LSLLGRIAAAFSRKPAPTVRDEPAKQYLGGPTAGDATRYGTVTDRINREYWTNATGVSVNNDLLAHLAPLQARAGHEYGTSPDFQGVCNTFAADVVGRNGPALQVISEDEIFNAAVEAAYRDVFADPDPAHRYSGVEDMRTWVLGLLLSGSYYNVLTTSERPGSRITFGWRSVSARRFVTPADQAGRPDVAFGCKYDETTGAAVEYYVQKPVRAGLFTASVDYDTIPAAAVQHVFVPSEAEQLTGAPMMASALDTSADLRDLGRFVQQSMKHSAANSPYLESMDPGKVINPDPVPTGSMRFEPGEVGIAPAGSRWAVVPPGQPIAEYLAYKRERSAELGRPIHMPLLAVLLSASSANFSSAQYEGTVYADGIAGVQGTIERRSMAPFVLRGIIPEVAMRNRMQPPKQFELVWTWNVPAHANIEKFVKAIRTMIEDGVISQAQGSALLGYDWEKVVASRKKCAEVLESNGLPAAPMNAGNPQQTAETADDDDSQFTSEGRQSASKYSYL
jgi:capsid protein